MSALDADLDAVRPLEKVVVQASAPSLERRTGRGERAAWLTSDARRARHYANERAAAIMDLSQIGGVAAFRPNGVVSGGGVGFDISCGVRTLLTGLRAADVASVAERLATALANAVPAGMGSRGRIRLRHRQMKAMLKDGAAWAVDEGYGRPDDRDRTEEHVVDGQAQSLFVHRKGATRAFGAGRAMSRHQAVRRWRGREVIDDLAAHGIIVRSRSARGVAEEAPGAYKDVTAVVDAAHRAGLSRRVARLVPLVCVKG